ncbi:MAG: phosphodiesterase [Geminicoccaceae bacterium]|nr:MAG: phosphodiesterase [Geminicoccaceae bacterium]
MFLVHLTDPHLVAPPRRLFGLDPFEGLDAALAHLCRHYADADLLLVTGDLTDLGEKAAYAALRRRLEALPMPVVLLLGNHDDRAAFRAVFEGAPVDEAGFVQQAVDHANGVSLVALDTHVPGAAHGELCAARLAWLDRALAARAARDVVIAMHHPPVGCGIPGMDAIGLADAERFWAVVRRHGNVRHVFTGHIHRTFFGRREAVSISALPGTSHQVHLQFATADVVLGSLEPGSYAVARLAPGQIDLHHVAFQDQSPRFVFDDASNAAAEPAALPPVPPPYDRLI